MLEWSRTNVLGLYKLLMRNGDRLKFTDKDFYLRRIRSEFKENRSVEASSERLRLLQVSPWRVLCFHYCVFFGSNPSVLYRMLRSVTGTCKLQDLDSLLNWCVNTFFF